MNVEFRISQVLRRRVLGDLHRPHAFAAERVGFLQCGVARVEGGTLLVLAQDFLPVADEDYLDDPTVGAQMGPSAIRKALQFAYNTPSSMFHVHCHEHTGRTSFSRTDIRESAKFVPDFFNVRPERPHGALVLSLDSAVGFCWTERGAAPVPLNRISFAGSPFAMIGRTA